MSEYLPSTEVMAKRDNEMMLNMLQDPHIKDSENNIRYTLTPIEISNLLNNMKYDGKPQKTFFLSVIEFVYIYSKYIQQNLYQRNLVHYAWSPTNKKNYLATLCENDNVALMGATLFENYHELADPSYKYVADENCKLEIPDFANRGNTMLEFVTGKITYKKKSFLDYYNEGKTSSIIGKQQLPVVIDFREKPYDVRKKNFKLLQQQKPVSQSGRLKNNKNKFADYLIDYKQMTRVEQIIIDILDKCYINSDAFWYLNLIRYLWIYKNSPEYSIEDMPAKITHTDDYYKKFVENTQTNHPAIELDDYRPFIDSLSEFDDTISNSGSKQKYTYGTLPVLYCIFRKECYDDSNILIPEKQQSFCKAISSYATNLQYTLIWINRRTKEEGRYYTQDDVIKFLKYEIKIIYYNMSIDIPNVPGSYKRPPIPKDIQNIVDDRDNRDYGECKCCYDIVGSSSLVFGHIQSYSDTQNHEETNITLICSRCNANNGKGDQRDFQREHYPDKLPIQEYINNYYYEDFSR